MDKRKRLRLKEYDYTSKGVYFITICIKDKQKLLCNIDDKIVESEYDNIDFNKYINLTKIGIVVKKELDTINNIYEKIKVKRSVIMPNHIHLLIENNDNKDISSIIQAFKRSITKKLEKCIWQRSFYEHIVRNNKELEEIEKYIIYNPLRWNIDEYY